MLQQPHPALALHSLKNFCRGVVRELLDTYHF